MRCRTLLLLAALVLLAGCAAPAPRADHCLALGGGSFCLLPPAALPAVRASHLVTLVQGAQRETFLGELAADGAELRLAAASLFGNHLFTVTWDGQVARSQPPREGLRPEWLAALLELALAEPARLQAGLYGLELEVAAADGRETRELRRRRHTVVRIEREGADFAAARLDIRVPRADLVLQLEPLEPMP